MSMSVMHAFSLTAQLYDGHLSMHCYDSHIMISQTLVQPPIPLTPNPHPITYQPIIACQ